MTLYASAHVCVHMYACVYLCIPRHKQHTPPDVHTPWNSWVSKKLCLGILGRWGLWQPQLTKTAGRELYSPSSAPRKNTARSEQCSGGAQAPLGPEGGLCSITPWGHLQKQSERWDTPTRKCMASIGVILRPLNLVHLDPLCASSGWEVSWEVESLSPEVPELSSVPHIFTYITICRALRTHDPCTQTVSLDLSISITLRPHPHPAD